MRKFELFAVIDWSGQNVAKPKGIAVAIAKRGDEVPALVVPPDRRWSRSEIVDWIKDSSDRDVLIGVDLSPGLPFVDCGSFFPGWDSSPTDAKELWQRVDRLCESSAHLSANGFLGDPVAREHFLHQGFRGAHFAPSNGRLRRCEVQQAAMGLSPSSCFKLVGANQVGKSSLTGMRVLSRINETIPVWPFDRIPEKGPAIVEIYTTIAAREAGLPKGRAKMRSWEELDRALIHPNIASHPTGRTGKVDDHTTDAILTAAWLRRAAERALLWEPDEITPAIAATEGWTFGVP